MKSNSFYNKAYNIFKKIIFVLILILPISWLSFQAYLPFGNHLLAVGHFSGSNWSDLNLIEKVFVSPFTSKKIIKTKGYSCDMHIIDIGAGKKLSYLDGSIGMSISMHDSNKVHLDNETKIFIRKTIRDLIGSCNPNLGTQGALPLIEAIFAEEIEFVELLLINGADPLLTYTRDSNNKLTPYRVAERLSEIEAERLKEDPNHPKATGQAKIIFEIIKTHIEKGDVDAQFDLGYMFEQAGNYEEAFRWYLAVAEQGHVYAQNNLATLYEHGKFVAQNYDEAARWYLAAAEQGLANAQYNLGTMYYHGRGVSQDDAEAYRWFSAAANQGDTNAQFNLGAMLELKSKYDEAFLWYFPAANQGHPAAQNNLATMYEYGKGITQNYFEAARWYLLAAEQGEAIAQYNLGSLYYMGHGVSQNYVEAIRWFLAAGELGYVDAQYNLALMYFQGEGISQNYAEAIRWSLAAAEQGDENAQYLLAMAYEFGVGVDRNLVTAFFWSSVSASQGNQDAVELRDRLVTLLTAKQIQEVEKLKQQSNFNTSY